MSEKNRMTFSDACRELGVSEAELERLVAAGEIASIKEGDTLFFTAEAVGRYKETKDPTVLLADDGVDEISFLDEDGVEEIDLLADDLLADDSAGAAPAAATPAAPASPADATGAAEEEITFDDIDFGVEETVETEVEVTSASGAAAASADEVGDDTVLSLDGLLEEDAEATTPVPAAADFGDDTLLDTELLDLSEDDAGFDVTDELDEDDFAAEGALLRGGGARVMQMKRKQSHGGWTVLLGLSCFLLLPALAVMTNLLFQDASETAQSASMYRWVENLNFLDPVIQAIAGLFG